MCIIKKMILQLCFFLKKPFLVIISIYMVALLTQTFIKKYTLLGYVVNGINNVNVSTLERRYEMSGSQVSPKLVVLGLQFNSLFITKSTELLSMNRLKAK